MAFSCRPAPRPPHQSQAARKSGLEWFGEYGSTSDWLSADEQEHQIGPVAVWKVDDNWSLYTGALFGATDVTPDSQLRFRLTRNISG